MVAGREEEGRGQEALEMVARGTEFRFWSGSIQGMLEGLSHLLHCEDAMRTCSRRIPDPPCPTFHVIFRLWGHIGS